MTVNELKAGDVAVVRPCDSEPCRILCFSKYHNGVSAVNLDTGVLAIYDTQNYSDSVVVEYLGNVRTPEPHEINLKLYR